MDRLLAGILNSTKTDNVKKTIIARIAASAKDESQPPEVVTAVLRSSLTFIVDGETESMMALSQTVFVDWASHHQHVFAEFFNESLASDLLQNGHRRQSGVIWVIGFSLGLISRNGSASYLRLCHMVGRQASNFVCYNSADFVLVKSLCSLLLEHRDCVPQGDSLHTFTTVLLQAVSGFTVPSDPVTVSEFIFELPSIIGKLLHEIWIHDADVVADTLRTVFDLVTESTSAESVLLLGAVIQFVPDVLMHSVLQSKASDTSLSDETALLVLSLMLDMLCWPSVKNIDMWIIAYMRGLAAAHRYSVLMDIARSKVDQVCVYQRTYLFSLLCRGHIYHFFDGLVLFAVHTDCNVVHP